MRLYTVSAIIGYTTKPGRGRIIKLPITDGIISSLENCHAWALEHDDVSDIRKWKRGSKTHIKSRSGNNIAMKNERRKKRKGAPK